MANMEDKVEEISEKERSCTTTSDGEDSFCNNNTNRVNNKAVSEPSLNPEIKCNEDEKQDLEPDNHISFKVPSLNQDVKISTKTKEPAVSTDVEKKDKAPELRYKVPWWSATPPQTDNFHLEILKNGCIISSVDLNDKAFHVFGRLPLCDVVLEHPSISRYHALIQYRGETEGDKSLSGFYLYDLGSTHGTLVNKTEIKSKTYYRLKVGYVIKFGGSSRLFVLQGPSTDDEEETETPPSISTSENTTTVKVGQIFTDEEYDSLKKVEKKTEESEGIDWGFGEDAEEEHIDSEKFEELYSGVEFKDPKKTLRGYYEREGLDLEYQVDETGPGHARVYHCRVRLPVDGPNGSAVYAEASVTGRKKEAVRECANEACKMLDAYGLLRQSTHESRKKRERNWEQDDFYESDEDNFLDRTGTVETKRLKRMQKAGKGKSEVQTYDSLLEKLRNVQEEIKGLEKQISDAAAFDEMNDEDSLDNFMNTIAQRMDKGTKIKLKRNIIELKKDEERIAKLVSLAKPTSLPSLQSPVKSKTEDSTTKKTSEETLAKMEKTAEEISIIKHTDLPKEKVSQSEESGNDINVTSDQHKLKSIAKENPELKTATMATPFAKPFTEFAVPPPPSLKPLKAKKDSKTRDNKGGLKPTAAEEKDKLKPKNETNNPPTKKTKSENKPYEEKNDDEDTSKDNSGVSKKKKRYTAPTQWEDANDPNFANWMPPEDQSGDGRTKLNDKYGY